MKAWWRLRRAVIEAAPLLQSGRYNLRGDTANRENDTRRWSVPLFHVQVRGGTAAEHDGLIRRSDCLILLAAERGHVTRLYRTAKKVDQLVANSRWLRPAFPCPEAEAIRTDLPNWHGVRETFVNGTILREADPTSWQPVYREFLQCCAENAHRCNGTMDPRPWFVELDTWKLPGVIGDAIERWREELEQILTDAPRLRSHGDAHNGNLLVNHEGRLAVIDVERAEDQPFFYDALSMPRGSEAVNRALRRDYLDGAFDNELSAVWQAAGQTFQPKRRAPYLMAAAVAHAFRPQFAKGPAARRREKFIKAVDKFADDIL